MYDIQIVLPHRHPELLLSPSSAYQMVTTRLLADRRPFCLLCPPTIQARCPRVGVDCRISMPSPSSLPSAPNTSPGPCTHSRVLSQGHHALLTRGSRI
ncbi:hypothetical protein FIBSPDRAFT_261772 [Athelia psychrophila]|uniref:Uncharacterized protein n=1 Tax=Athelia psychrophila TaxID=1759441 RepID=A0A165XHE5_9AGAM|nr:hypothetical protein FIBSPDRAFT_261772 [Fibularhizoctonia sp. CBS 109695]